MKYFSMFSGIGGFELGIQQSYEDNYKRKYIPKQTRTREYIQHKWNQSNIDGQTDERRNSEIPTCIGYSEIDKYAIQIYERHFKHKNYGDCTKIITSELPDFDLLVGGFPCQSFSIAGKRGGFKDTRGTMFFEIARIARDKRPSLLLLENVKGLLNHDKGNTFATIISTLDELGYDCQWCVLNSKNFGVPQNRERVFFVGHIRGEPRPKVFPIGEGNGISNETYKPKTNEIASCLRASNYKGMKGSHISQGYRVYDPQGIKQLNKPNYKEDGGYEMGRRVYSPEGISPTCQAQGSKEIKIKKDTRIRRLTPTECERLQGFPDGWTEGVSDTQRYKTLGNAVTVNVVREVVKTLL